MKRFIASSIVIFSGITLLHPDSARAAILIDNFTDVSGDQQFVNRGGPTTGVFAVPQIAITEQPGTAPGFTDVLGGYRDLWLQAVSGTTTTSTRTATGAVADGVLTFSNGTGVQSWLNVTWDGDDTGSVGTNTVPGPGNNSANPTSLGTPASPGNFADTATDLRLVKRSGLGTQDLTNGGILNSIALELISADLGINIVLTVYDTNGTGISRGTFASPGVTNPAFVYFAFNSRALANVSSPDFGVLLSPLSGGGARFTNVGAINLSLQATRTDVDASLRLLEATNTKVPEPTTSGLGLSAIGTVAFFSLKNRKKKNG